MGLQNPGVFPRTVVLSLGAFPPTRCRLIGLALPPRPLANALRQVPTRRSASLGLEVFPRRPALGRRRRCLRVSPTELDPSESVTIHQVSRVGLRCATPLMRFGDSCSTIHLSSPPTRVCLTRYVPPSGFLTLSMVCSSTDCPALFHAGALMEPCPFRAFPSPGAVPPLGGLCPLAVDPARPGRGLSTTGTRGVMPRSTPQRFAIRR
jgi:hypothetical protein